MNDVQAKALTLVALMTSPTDEDNQVFNLVKDAAMARSKDIKSWPFNVRVDDILIAIGEVYK
jgi:hypothetical protein